MPKYLQKRGVSMKLGIEIASIVESVSLNRHDPWVHINEIMHTYSEAIGSSKSRRTFQRYLRDLEEIGIIETQNRPVRMSGVGYKVRHYRWIGWPLPLVI